jgi:hypothetical protein
MKAMEFGSRWTKAAGASVAAAALAFTAACSGTPNVPGVSAQALDAGAQGTPVLVTCEPNQRTLVRPTVVNGATVSQVECVSASAVAPVPAGQAAPPAAYGPAAAPVYTPARRAAQPVYSDLGDAEVVPVGTRAPRTVQTRQVVYDERPVRQTRSVKKSAIIIGSSAGVGAGVGAAMGGKKGALIGAAIGGGGAAIWDQVTRRK